MRARSLPALLLVLAACAGPGAPAPGDADPAPDRPDVADTLPGDPGPRDPAGPDAPPPADLPDAAPVPDTPVDAPADAAPDAGPPASCGFEYAPLARPAALRPPALPRPASPVPAHRAVPPPAGFRLLPAAAGSLVMPGYQDDLPLFERARDWGPGTRCFELPGGPANLAEAEAYALYRDLAQATTGVPVDDTPGRRTVVGLRGAWPGTFAWNGNEPDRFDDTLVLLWREPDGRPRVLEFPASLDTGAWPFDRASSLWPNRHYRYRCGWHSDYNALAIDEEGYTVRDDANHNGHWDSDRNGWLPPAGPEDFDRAGSAHNIHLASVDAPLETAAVGPWSAGCQNVPGMANWTRFITRAWTAEGDEVDYHLLDARDVPASAWSPCTPDGTHACPYPVAGLPFEDEGTTAGAPASEFDRYNCSAADESGPEVVYVLTTPAGGTLRAVLVDAPATGAPDVDVHLLMADDPRACLARGHLELEAGIPPGRYFVVADTYVEDGVPLAGPYRLRITLDP